MSEPFYGEIRMFAGSFAPRGNAFCDGQLLPIPQNDALFSLLGTIYGGDGRTTFGLPDLRGRVPIHEGSGPGLSPRRLGAKGGAETETVTTAQLPAHQHNFSAVAAAGTSASPGGNVCGNSTVASYVNNPANVNMASASPSSGGGGASHTNLMPTQCINFIIALVGIYPSRS